jgi:hypothetical protein
MIERDSCTLLKEPFGAATANREKEVFRHLLSATAAPHMLLHVSEYPARAVCAAPYFLPYCNCSYYKLMLATAKQGYSHAIHCVLHSLILPLLAAALLRLQLLQADAGHGQAG